ncbi:hypothetical protein [Salinisphaera sp. G21_0]|uniref:hypothetical protein n=1 Tax=Salinisphaera sp. G21_0 TaxID=2821094 RepID=UPI001ADA28C3|nr:hypothetical protein [Salinisphaera sp. G21_0]MBO9483213.1 hypothetical protein [Salinisphaera sp. G21_0]
MDTSIRNLPAVAQRPQQSGPQEPPGTTEFSGRSVYVGAGSSNIPSPPPTHSLLDPPGPDYSCLPPACTSIANNPGTGLVSGDDLPATFKRCLLRLNEAYDTNFSELADTLSDFVPMSSLKAPFWKIFHEVIDPPFLESNSSQKIRELGQKIRQLYIDEHDVLATKHAYPRISELTIVLCMHFLEQKFILEHPEPIQQSSVDVTRSDEASTDCQHLLPAWVRKTFFEKLLSGIDKSGRATAGIRVKTFIKDNQSGLEKDMSLQQPATGHLKFSGLRYDDIPGATVAKLYHSKLSDHSRDFSIDLRGLIEALGQTQSRCWPASTSDPLENAMKRVANKTHKSRLKPENFFNNKLEPFRDRNARTLLELIKYFQNRVTRQHRNGPTREAPEMGEKYNVAHQALQESSAGIGQRSRTMKESLRIFLTNCCENNKRVKRRLESFFDKT